MINSTNEWDRLRKVVVGSATHANWPVTDSVFKNEGLKTTWKKTPVPKGPVPQWIIDETNEDLDTLVDTLKKHDIEVIRPDALNFQTHDGMYNYCPRDRLLVWGSKIINPVMMYPCRDMELQCYVDILEQADQVIEMPRNSNMVLDAANVLRMNDRWLFLESASGNRAAYDWLCQTVDNVEIEICSFYGGVHIDSTVSALRDGVVLLNANRVSESNCPKVFDGWTKIYVDSVVEQSFYQYPYASKWIALNVLSISPDTVIVDRNQIELIRNLENHHFTVIPLELRHSRTLGGGFHCVTLDLVRSN
jgi:N-dimethylarginine dimethylaminohydrolase